MRRRFVSCALVAVLAYTRAASAAVIDATWQQDGNGAWGTATNWDVGVVPSNNSTDQYNVRIDNDMNFNVAVSLNIDPTINSLMVDSGDAVIIDNGITFSVIGGTITNNGLISIAATTGSNLVVANSTTLNGTGRLVLGGNSINDYVYSVNPTDELINGATHTISGGGQLGFNNLKLTNQGLIDANLSGQTMYVDPSTSGASNAGTMQASGGGTLRLQGGTFTNAGLIQALDNSQVQLGARVVGGTFATSGTGKFVVGNDTATLSGTITNNGLISIEATTGAVLEIANSTTLNGTGRLVLGGNSINDYVYSVNPTDELINGATHTISGGGRLGFDGLKLTNQGLIDANLSGQTMYVDPSASGASNTGTMQASSGGTLRLQSGTFTNSGLIQALDNSQVQLGTGATVVGGTLSTSGTGKFVVGNETPKLSGTITNNGLISMEATTGSVLEIANGTTLNGTGRLVLGGNSINDYVYSVNPTDELINGATHTISGGGRLGFGNLKLTNQGLIDANLPGQTMYVDPSASGASNTGTMQASGGGVLFLIEGAFDNQGKVAALNGSNVTYDGTAVTSNNVAGVLTGGKWHAVSTGGGATLTLRGNPIHTIAEVTEVELNGAGSVIQVAATPIDSTLTTNHGSFSVINGRNFAAPSAFSNTGTLTIGTGSTFTAPGGFTQATTAAVQGTGTFQGNLTNPGVIGPGTSTGILTIDGNLTQTSAGLLEIEVGGVTPGSQHDKLVVTGSTALGGQLEVPIVNGYVPQLGDSVTILTSPNVTGKFAALYAPDLATLNPNVAIEVTQSTTDVQLHFVAPLTNTQFAPNNAVIDWTNSGAWNTGVEPDSRHVLALQNPAGVDQIVDVENGDAFAHELAINGDSSHTMTLSVKNGRSLSTTADTTVGDHAILALGDEHTKGQMVGRRLVVKKGGKLKGNGTLGRSSDVRNELRNKTAKKNVLTFKNLNSGNYSIGGSVGYLEVEGDYEQDADGELEIELESPSSFDKFVITGDAKLGGTLDIALLNFVPQAGNVFDFMDWETVVGTFDTLHLPALAGGLTWELSQLYTAGSLAVAGVLGDYNLNGIVDAADYTVWRDTLGSSTFLVADGDADGTIDDDDYLVWKANFGQHAPGAGSGAAAGANTVVPEPATLSLIILAAAGCCVRRRLAA